MSLACMWKGKKKAVTKRKTLGFILTKVSVGGPDSLSTSEATA